MDALTRYYRASADLAICIDVDDRLATDANYPGDRNPHATRMRAEQLAAALAEFRAAGAALNAEVAA